MTRRIRERSKQEIVRRRELILRVKMMGVAL